MHELRKQLVPIIEQLASLQATAVVHAGEAGAAAIASGSASDAEHDHQRAQQITNYLHAATEAIRAVIQTVDYRDRDLKARAEREAVEAGKKASLEQQLSLVQATQVQLEAELARAQAEVRKLRAEALEKAEAVSTPPAPSSSDA